METTIELAYNRQKISAIKEELKNLAEEIKITKSAFKEAQRNRKEPWIIQAKLKSLKFQFRHRLIAYSLTRGRKYEQIECRVRENNEPNWTFIKGLQDELTN